jgi:lambda family phage minor tail protein L
MAFADWTATTAFVVGDIRSATTKQASGLVFRCTAAGTSAASEPAWPNDIGSTVTDGTVTWTAISSVYEELSKLAPSAIVELFELHLDETLHGSTDLFRWHNGVNADVTGNIVWNGNSYVRFPVKAEGFEYTNTGTLPRPTLTVANLDGSISVLLLEVNWTTAGNDLAGAQVRRIRTLKKYLDGEATADPNAAFPEEIWYVDRKATETRDFIQFELASKFDLAGIKLPRRQIIANVCQWKYRSSECGYTSPFYYDAANVPVLSAEDDVCGKRLDSCRVRFDTNVLTGFATVGSTLVTLGTAGAAIEAGNSVLGFGIPSGATVASTNADRSVITLSAAATATTSVTVNGAIQSADPSKIVVADATGLAVGMDISGTNITSGTLISAINGTTITMSQPANITLAFTSAGTFSGVQLGDANGGNSQYLYSNTDVLNVGDYITGPGLSTTDYTKITQEYYRRDKHVVSCWITYLFSGSSEPQIGTCKYLYRYTLAVAGQAQGFPDPFSLTTYNKYTAVAQPTYSYTFSGSNQYSFVKNEDGLPFGGFPGAGLIR